MAWTLPLGMDLQFIFIIFFKNISLELKRMKDVIPVNLALNAGSHDLISCAWTIPVM